MKPRREKDPDPEWQDCNSLMEWAEAMFRRGYPAIVLNVVKTLPEWARPKYKALYERIQAEKKAGPH